MSFKFLIIPSVLLFQLAGAQTGTTTASPAPATTTAQVSASSSTIVNSADPVSPGSGSADATDQVAIIDYQSVFETATIEEEVKMAAERYKLSQSQKEMWYNAALDRRSAEAVAKQKLESKDPNVSRDAVYRGLRSSHNTFNEIVTGYMSPTQKQAMENDRIILEEKRKRIAKLPPPPPPAPTVTVAPIDSTAIKADMKAAEKKNKKKKKKG